MAEVARRTQEERKAQSERAIVEAAIELFSTEGYVKTTLSQVGKKAGYTGGLISNRFGSKENLLRAVLENISRGFREGVAERFLDDSDVKNSLHHYVHAYLSAVGKKKSSIRALYIVMGEALGAVSGVQADLAAFNRETREQITSLVRHGVESGQIDRRIDPESASLILLSLIRGVTMQLMTDPKACSLDSAIAEVNRAMDAYLWSEAD